MTTNKKIHMQLNSFVQIAFLCELKSDQYLDGGSFIIADDKSANFSCSTFTCCSIP